MARVLSKKEAGRILFSLSAILIRQSFDNSRSILDRVTYALEAFLLGYTSTRHWTDPLPCGEGKRAPTRPPVLHPVEPIRAPSSNRPSHPTTRLLTEGSALWEDGRSLENCGIVPSPWNVDDAD
jgi:hypothetical protein